MPRGRAKFKVHSDVAPEGFDEDSDFFRAPHNPNLVQDSEAKKLDWGTFHTKVEKPVVNFSPGIKVKSRNDYKQDGKNVAGKKHIIDPKSILTRENEGDSAKEDYYGIIAEKVLPKLDEQGNPIWPTYPSSLSKDQIYDKYWEPNIKEELIAKEKVVRARYGFMRFDPEENIPKSKARYRGKKEPEVIIKVIGDINDVTPSSKVTERRNSRKMTDDKQKSFGSDFIESQYFNYNKDNDGKNSKDETVTKEDMIGSSFIESQYFGSQSTDTDQQATSLNEIAKQYSLEQVTSQPQVTEKKTEEKQKECAAKETLDVTIGQLKQKLEKHITKETLNSTSGQNIESQYFTYNEENDRKNSKHEAVTKEDMIGSSFIESQYFGSQSTDTDQQATSLNEIAKQYSLEQVTSQPQVTEKKTEEKQKECAAKETLDVTIGQLKQKLEKHITKETLNSTSGQNIESQYFTYNEENDRKNSKHEAVTNKDKIGSNFIDNQYFGSQSTDTDEQIPSLNEIAKQYSNVSHGQDTLVKDAHEAESEVFSTGSEQNNHGQIQETFNNTDDQIKQEPDKDITKEALNIVAGQNDRQLAGQISRQKKHLAKETVDIVSDHIKQEPKTHLTKESLETTSRQINHKPEKHSAQRQNDQVMLENQQRKFPKSTVIERKELDLKNSEVYGKISERARSRMEEPKPNLEDPKTAYDFAMKIRQESKGEEKIKEDKRVAHPSLANWKGKLDSQGFRILKDQVVNLEYMPREEVVSYLKDSIIFQNDDIVAIDKPYGLPSHGGPGIHHSVGGLLKDLAKRLKDQRQPLYLVHRLDKETTGVMLLARNAEIAYKLHGMFKRREVSKTYWALTKGVPSPREGIIDIPMGEDEVKGRMRMGLRPYKDKNLKFVPPKTRPGSRFEAVTEFKVLSSISSAALVQCTPLTGIKHQIRCHLAFGLNTPILGDHKYSHYSEIKPQKVQPEILTRLKIRQPTVRYLAMHLHATQLVLPEFYSGKNAIIKSRLPSHFVQNMKWLKIAIPK